MSGVPYSTVARTMEHLGLTKGDKLGSGKTAVVYAAITPGGHRRAVRIATFDFASRSDYDDLRRSLHAAHRYIETLMPGRVPRLHGVHLVPSKRRPDRILAIAHVMGWVEGAAFGEKEEYTPAELADLRLLLRQLWSNRISHGDLFHGNLLLDAKTRRWVLVDLDNLKTHATPTLARRRDAGMLDPNLVRLLLRR